MGAFRDEDRGAMRVLLNAGKLKRNGLKTMRVGVPEGPTYEDGTSVVAVAAFQEFGTDVVPPRPFIRGWYDGKSAKRLVHPFQLWGMAVLRGDATADEAYAAIGDQFVMEVRAGIDRRIPPPLLEATIRKKASTGAAEPDVPLKDTRLLYDSIAWWTP